MIWIKKLRQNKTLSLFIAILAISFLMAYPAHSEDTQTPADITSDMRCPNCGMMPAKYPKFNAQVILSGHHVNAYDSNKCMFKSLLGPDKPNHEIQAIWVRDHSNGEWINGKDAQYVVGSDVMGPMGKDLLAFSTHRDAMQFQTEHGGAMAKYGDICMDTLKSLMGNMHGQSKSHHDMGSMSSTHGSGHGNMNMEHGH